MVFIDSSALIRFCLDDDPIKADRVEKLLDSDEEIMLLECVLVELQFVLLKLYQMPKVEVVSIMRVLVERPNVRSNPEAKLALNIFEKTNFSFPDCLVLVYSEGEKLATFDDSLAKIGGIRGYRKK